MSLLNDIASYWKLEDTSDSVGGNTLTNTATTFAPAKINNGAVFNGSTAILRVSNVLQYTGNFSISGWINPTDATGAAVQTIIVNELTGTSGGPYRVSIQTSGKLRFSVYATGTGAETFVESAAALSDATTVFFTCVRDGTNIIIYLNGVYNNQTAWSTSQITNASNFFQIGATQNGGGTKFLQFTGWVDEVGVWPIALTSDEVVSLYNSNQGNQYPFIPYVTTQDVSEIDVTSSTANGTVVLDNGSIIIERGFCWNTAGTPTTGDSRVVVSGTTGAYSGQLTGLVSDTLYYVRAYAISSSGTSYGDNVLFTTSTVASNSLYWDINGVDGATYAVQLYVGGTTGSVTVKLGSTGDEEVVAAGAGTTTFQGEYGGLNGLIIEASGTFDGYIDNVYYVLVVGDATIDWSLDTLTNIFPINSSVLFRRLEDKDFNSFRVYRYLDIQFKDLDAYVTVLLKNEANEEVTEDTKQFLVSNVSTDTLPFIKKRISFLKKNQAMLIQLSNNRLNERFTICQFIIKGFNEPNRQFDGGKIINVV